MAKRINKKLACKVEIYNTCYTLTQHNDGSVTIRAPYVRWSNSNGKLAFAKHHLAGQDAQEAKNFFANDTLCLDANNKCGLLTLDDLLNGYRFNGVTTLNTSKDQRA